MNFFGIPSYFDLAVLLFDANGQAHLPHTPNPASSVKLWRNGLLLEPAEFSISGTLLTLKLKTLPLDPQDVYLAEFRY